MSNANTCIFCGEVIPEGRQICPRCAEKVPTANSNHNPYFNGEMYPDPTAYGAIRKARQNSPAALDAKVNVLIKDIKRIANEAGFEITNRIELRDKNTGRVFK